MEKKIFNPSDWLIKNKPTQTPMPIPENNNAITEVEDIIQQIEEKQIDIASAYSDWRDIGFAFADALGEDGRNLYHRISRFFLIIQLLNVIHNTTTALKQMVRE